MDTTIIPPCTASCPLSQDVRGYVALIAEGRFDEASELIRQTNPMPSVCGRICSHPCESECRRADVDEPVAICALKRFVTDNSSSKPRKYKIKHKKKIAIVGAGPAGLATAQRLTELGYAPTVFEIKKKAGGLLAYGIPSYRLPKPALAADLRQITKKVKFISSMSADVENLKKKYDAVVVASGASAGCLLSIPGEDLSGVYSGVDFLQSVKSNKPVNLGRRVAIIGGGNTAFDSARTALRLGCKSVHLIYRRSASEMPANKEEFEEAVEEGVDVRFLISPTAVNGKKRRVTSVECVKMKLGKADKSGRLKPIEIKNSKFRINVDSVIVAIGQGPALNKFSGKNIFYCGDAVSGTSTVTEALASGIDAANSVHNFLTGRIADKNAKHSVLEDIGGRISANIKGLPRQRISKLPAKKRRDSFAEVEMCYDEVSAVREALRCLSCGLSAQVEAEKCVACLACVKVCPYEIPKIIEGVSYIDNAQCQSCGLCAAECPADAIKMNSQHSYDDVKQMIINSLGKGKKVLGFSCRFQKYYGTGDSVKLPDTVSIIEIPCNSVLYEQHFLDALEQGYNGVFLLGCSENDCRHYTGCVKAVERLDSVKELLGESNIDPTMMRLIQPNQKDIKEFVKSCTR